MLTNKRIAAFAVVIAAAIVPSIGAQAAEARPGPANLVGVELCHPKWILGPNAVTHTHSIPSVEDLDVENETASGEPNSFDPETVAWDDLSYDGC